MPEANVKKIGKYQILKELGSGATSKVFLGVDPFTNQRVAIKLMYADELRDKEHGKRYQKLFLTEASLAGKLNHPHIVAIYDAVADEESSYIVMEYVEGGTLEPYGKVDNLLPIEKVVEIIFKCCRAFDYAYRNGVIHRDVKPANILLTTDNKDIKISDFGTAINQVSLRSHPSQQSTQVTGIGSPAYMSPQQVRDEPLTHQTDIYSLGVVMYQLLTGKLPLLGKSHASMMYQIMNVEPSPPSTLRPELPSGLDLIVKRALAKDLKGRYQSWEEFEHDLVKAFKGFKHITQDSSDSKKFQILREMKFCKPFSDVELWEVVRISLWDKVEPDTVIIKEGEVGNSLYLVASGKVRVTKQGRLLNELARGDCFGVIPYFSQAHAQRNTTVTAAGEAMVVNIRADSLLKTSESCQHNFNKAFMEILVQRLSEADARLASMMDGEFRVKRELLTQKEE